MLKRAIAKKKTREPFNIVEAGCGEIPIGLLKRALEAKKKGRNRSFVGIDEHLNIEALLKTAGIKELPNNLRFMESCANHALLSAPERSQDLIFSSFLLNSLSGNASCLNPMHSCEDMYLQAAKRALKPGGKIIAIQDKYGVDYVRTSAKRAGLGFFVVDLPKEVAKKSPAKYVQLRATPERRKIFIKKMWGAEAVEHAKQLVKEGKLKNWEEYAKPTLIIMKKPRNAKDKPIEIVQKESDLFSLLNALLREM